MGLFGKKRTSKCQRRGHRWRTLRFPLHVGLLNTKYRGGEEEGGEWLRVKRGLEEGQPIPDPRLSLWLTICDVCDRLQGGTRYSFQGQWDAGGAWQRFPECCCGLVLLDPSQPHYEIHVAGRCADEICGECGTGWLPGMDDDELEYHESGDCSSGRQREVAV